MNQLASAPLLVELYRGFDKLHNPIVERVHNGIIAVVDGLGRTVYAKGDISCPTHTRSTAKPMQILPLMESGFFDDEAMQKQFSLTPSDLVLMMSSHAAESFHTSRVLQLLTAAGLDVSALRCGAHQPYDHTSFAELLRTNKKPSVLHNNCSGKHVAMLLTCMREGYDQSSYEDPQHPLQQRIKKFIATVADIDVDNIDYGIDGCSLPSFVMPLKNIALMYARLSYWAHSVAANDVPPFLSHAFAKIWSAIVGNPDYLAGTRRFDSELIRLGAGAIVSKGGADGIIALAIAPSEEHPTGLGVVIKIADGDVKQQVRNVVVQELLSSLGVWPKDPALLLHLPPVTNFRGLTVSGYRCWL